MSNDLMLDGDMDGNDNELDGLSIDERFEGLLGLDEALQARAYERADNDRAAPARLPISGRTAGCAANEAPAAPALAAEPAPRPSDLFVASDVQRPKGPWHGVGNRSLYTLPCPPAIEADRDETDEAFLETLDRLAQEGGSRRTHQRLIARALADCSPIVPAIFHSYRRTRSLRRTAYRYGLSLFSARNVLDEAMIEIQGAIGPLS